MLAVQSALWKCHCSAVSEKTMSQLAFSGQTSADRHFSYISCGTPILYYLYSPLGLRSSTVQVCSGYKSCRYAFISSTPDTITPAVQHIEENRFSGYKPLATLPSHVTSELVTFPVSTPSALPTALSVPVAVLAKFRAPRFLSVFFSLDMAIVQQLAVRIQRNDV